MSIIAGIFINIFNEVYIFYFIVKNNSICKIISKKINF